MYIPKLEVSHFTSKLCPSSVESVRSSLRGGWGVPTPLILRIRGRDAAAAAAGQRRWRLFDETFTDSVKGEYGEDVGSVDWV